MRSFARCLLVVIAAAAATAAQAQVTVSNAWVRGTVQGQTATGAYMQLKSADDATLVGADSPAAGIVEIHEMRMEGNTMRMRGVDKLELPAGRAVELKPGGYHVMLMDLQTVFKAGSQIRMTLRFVDAKGAPKKVAVSVPVAAAAPARR